MEISTDSSILFISDDSKLRGDLEALFNSFLPELTLLFQSDIGVETIQECSIIILDESITHNGSLEEFMYSLKTMDNEPGTVVLSSTSDPVVVNEFYASGFQRCILREGEWGLSLVRSIDQIVRYQRIHLENLKLRSKLTEANKMLVEKNKRLDQFAAGVSHDIRSPLATVIMRLELLADQMKKRGLNSEELLITRSLESSNRMIELVQGLYEYAKLGSELRNLEKVQLEQLVREVFIDLDLDSSCDVEVTIDELPTVWGSKKLLRQLLLNLISNSIKYSDTKPIELELQWAGWKEMNIAKFAVFNFCDNGPGIQTSERERIFSFFERGSLDVTRVEGTGLGLAMARRIVELHNGEIRLVDPQNERGVRFEIVLPVEPLDYLTE